MSQLPERRRCAPRSGLLAIAVLAVVLCNSSYAQKDERALEDRLVIVVRGAEGASEYGPMFDEWSNRWQRAAGQPGTRCEALGLGIAKDAKTTDRDRLQQLLAAWAKVPVSESGELWIVMIGHGTFDGRRARFNLRGPDVSASELANWIEPVTGPVAVVNCASASAPFMAKLAGPNRVIVTATKSGAEHNFARFGGYLSEAITETKADLDKDGQTSLFEAFLSASRKTTEFYVTEGRLATEHSLLDDNGDGKGVRSDWFRGIRAIRKSTDGTAVDGLRAHQFHLVRSADEQKLPAQMRQQRDKLELAVIALRDRKASFKSEDEYFAELEGLLVQMARLYDGVSSQRE